MDGTLFRFLESKNFLNVGSQMQPEIGRRDFEIEGEGKGKEGRDIFFRMPGRRMLPALLVLAAIASAAAAGHAGTEGGQVEAQGQHKAGQVGVWV